MSGKDWSERELGQTAAVTAVILPLSKTICLKTLHQNRGTERGGGVQRRRHCLLLFLMMVWICAAPQWKNRQYKGFCTEWDSVTDQLNVIDGNITES